MRRMWFTSEQPGKGAAPAATAGGRGRAGVVSLKSSASLRRMGDNKGIANGSFVTSASFNWGWSRFETARLVRMQASVRGWLVRRRVCRIPATDVGRVLKDVHQRDKGLRRLVAYMCFFVLFFAIVILESDVTYQHAVEMSINDVIHQVTSGPDGDVRLLDVSTRQEFSAWVLSLYMSIYDGTELEDVCNTCASLRGPSGRFFFPEIPLSVWGTELPLASSSSLGNDSFVFELDNCPLCYGSDRASVVGEPGSLGNDFCEICCADVEFCFEGRCADFGEITPQYAEVKGTNASLVTVFSNEDCYGETVVGQWFARDIFIRLGMTSVLARGYDSDGGLVLHPTGRGYVGNKNKVIGVLLTEWSYYKEGRCASTVPDSFYSCCYEDEANSNNIKDYLLAQSRNELISIGVKEGSRGEGLVYSSTTDIGAFNTGLNLNRCGLLGIMNDDEIINDAVRKISLRFNTYNGQCGGLFSSVDISATFALGGGVDIHTDVEVFAMPYFFDTTAVIVARAVSMFAFALMLAGYVAKDVYRALRELKHGQERLSVRKMKIPISTVSILNLMGDGVFLWGLALWVAAAITASNFELVPTLVFDEASEQVRAFSEELSSVARGRGHRDAAAVAGGIFGLSRLFLMLRFHPRLSLVTDVVSSAAVHLVHFFIMFFMVVGVFSNVCWVIFGPTSDLFTTWTTSFVTMTRVALGEFDNIYPVMVEINPEAAQLIIVTYQTLQGILLLNIAISILLDGFQMVQRRNCDTASDTLWQTIMTSFGRWRIGLVNTVAAYCRLGRSSHAHQHNSHHASANAVTGVPVGPPWGGGVPLTRGQRIALSNRYYDVRTAVELLRRSPLPEKVVWRKMRQIVEARLSGTPVRAGSRRIRKRQSGEEGKGS